MIPPPPLCWAQSEPVTLFVTQVLYKKIIVPLEDQYTTESGYIIRVFDERLRATLPPGDYSRPLMRWTGLV